MPVNDAGWVATTHDWSSRVDRAHLAQIREHPDGYCPGGPLHLLLEVMAYANEEASELARPGLCQVRLHIDGSVSVTDDGRGTETRQTPSGQVVRKPVTATEDLRFFDRPEPELLPDGSPRRGMSVVAALSDWLVHTNRRLNGAWEQRYEHGVPTGQLRATSSPGVQGTTVHYLANQGVFTDGAITAERVVEVAKFPWLQVSVRA